MSFIHLDEWIFYFYNFELIPLFNRNIVITIEYIKHIKGMWVFFPPSSDEIRLYTDGAGA